MSTREELMWLPNKKKRDSRRKKKRESEEKREQLRGKDRN